MWRIRYFFESIKNLIRWFPIIWKDRDWDGWYTLKLLKTKIEHIKRCHENSKGYVGWENEVKWMGVVINLLDNILDSKYWDDEYDNKIPSKNNVEPNYLKFYGMGGVYADTWEHKAERLAFKILAWKNQTWWD